MGRRITDASSQQLGVLVDDIKDYLEADAVLIIALANDGQPRVHISGNGGFAYGWLNALCARIFPKERRIRPDEEYISKPEGGKA